MDFTFKKVSIFILLGLYHFARMGTCLQNKYFKLQFYVFRQTKSWKLKARA